MRISQQQILEMECHLLLSKFKSEATISLVQEKIAVATGEDSIHRASAFKHGLQQAALNSKKLQAGATNSAPPRHNSICPTCATRTIPSLSLSSGVWCGKCEQTYQLCMRCGCLRDVSLCSLQCNSCQPMSSNAMAAWF